MAKTNSTTRRDDETLRSGDVPDQTVAQVGKAVAQILKLRQTLEEHWRPRRPRRSGSLSRRRSRARLSRSSTTTGLR